MIWIFEIRDIVTSIPILYEIYQINRIIASSFSRIRFAAIEFKDETALTDTDVQNGER